MPVGPVTPSEVKVATPFVAVAVVVPRRLAPADTDAVTTVLLSLVITEPAEERTSTAGWVVNADPDAAPAADVRTASSFGVNERTQIAAVEGT